MSFYGDPCMDALVRARVDARKKDLEIRELRDQIIRQRSTIRARNIYIEKLERAESRARIIEHATEIIEHATETLSGD